MLRSTDAGYHPDPKDKPLTEGYQPRPRPDTEILPPPPPRNRGPARLAEDLPLILDICHLHRMCQTLLAIEVSQGHVSWDDLIEFLSDEPLVQAIIQQAARIGMAHHGMIRGLKPDGYSLLGKQPPKAPTMQSAPLVVTGPGGDYVRKTMPEQV